MFNYYLILRNFFFVYLGFIKSNSSVIYSKSYNVNFNFILKEKLSSFVFIRQTSRKWSRFLDEYPDRFKINYPLPDEDNDLYFPSRPGRYPVRFFSLSNNNNS